MSWITRLLAIIPFLFLTACFQEERSYTLNSDGSGKVDFAATFPLDSGMKLSFGDGGEKEPDEKLRDAVREILEDSDGVAAWTDVSFKLSKDQKVEFKGTAYFSDLNALDLKMGSISSNSLVPSFSLAGDTVTIECAQDEDAEEDGDGEEGDDPDWKDLSEVEQKAEVAKVKLQLTQMKGMMMGVMGDMKTKVTFKLPAKGSKSHNVEKLADDSFTVEATGEDMLKAMDVVIESVDLLEAAARGGADMQAGPPDELFEAMFGQTGNPSVSFSAKAGPAFDFKAELKAAQEGSSAMMKKLGLEIVPAVPMTDGGAFESLRLAGLRIVTASSDDDVRPFNWSKGISLAFIGKLPGAVISADKGVVKSFVLDNGQNLLSSKKWDRDIRGVDLSEDGTLVGFEINSDRLPTAEAKAIKELTGELICTAATGTETIDLGFAKLAAGEEGKLFGAKIEEIGDHSFHEDKKEVSIHFKTKRELIKDVHFVDADGVTLKSSRSGYSWGGDSGTLTFTCDKALTENHRVEIETFTGISRHVISFNIENTPLMPAAEKDE